MAGDSTPFATRVLVLTLGLALAAGCKAAPLAEGNVPPDTIRSTFDWDAYALGAGDVVAVTVFGHPEFSTLERGERIDLRGNVNLPLVGAVKIGEGTTEEARVVIRDAVAEYLVDPAVTVSVIEYGSRRVYVMGEVATPGSFPLDRPINALQALSLGGGFRDGADRETIALLRAREDQLEVHYFNGATPGLDGLVAVEPGDFLFVRQSGSGRFSDQIMPYLQGAAPGIGAITNLLVIEDALTE